MSRGMNAEDGIRKAVIEDDRNDGEGASQEACRGGTAGARATC